MTLTEKILVSHSHSANSQGFFLAKISLGASLSFENDRSWIYICNFYLICNILRFRKYLLLDHHRALFEKPKVPKPMHSHTHVSLRYAQQTQMRIPHGIFRDFDVEMWSLRTSGTRAEFLRLGSLKLSFR